MSHWLNEALSEEKGLKHHVETLGNAKKIGGLGLDSFHAKRKQMGHWAMGLSSKGDVHHEERNGSL